MYFGKEISGRNPSQQHGASSQYGDVTAQSREQLRHTERSSETISLVHWAFCGVSWDAVFDCAPTKFLPILTGKLNRDKFYSVAEIITNYWNMVGVYVFELYRSMIDHDLVSINPDKVGSSLH